MKKEKPAELRKTEQSVIHDETSHYNYVTNNFKRNGSLIYKTIDRRLHYF